MENIFNENDINSNFEFGKDFNNNSLVNEFNANENSKDDLASILNDDTSIMDDYNKDIFNTDLNKVNNEENNLEETNSINFENLPGNESIETPIENDTADKIFNDLKNDSFNYETFGNDSNIFGESTSDTFGSNSNNSEELTDDTFLNFNNDNDNEYDYDSIPFDDSIFNTLPEDNTFNDTITDNQEDVKIDIPEDKSLEDIKIDIPEDKSLEDIKIDIPEENDTTLESIKIDTIDTEDNNKEEDKQQEKEDFYKEMDNSINELKANTDFTINENENVLSDINNLFTKVNNNVKEASDVFARNVEMKKILDNRFEELKQIQSEIEDSKKKNYDEINSYKEEVINNLTEKKNEIEEKLELLKKLQSDFDKEKNEFETYKKDEIEKISKMRKEEETSFETRRNELNELEDKLRKQKDFLEDEKRQLSLDQIQYESDKNELANNMIKFNDIVSKFTSGIDGIN